MNDNIQDWIQGWIGLSAIVLAIAVLVVVLSRVLLTLRNWELALRSRFAAWLLNRRSAREADERPSKLKAAAADARHTYDLRVALIKTSGVDPVESHAAQEHAKQQRVKTLTQLIDQC